LVARSVFLTGEEEMRTMREEDRVNDGGKDRTKSETTSSNNIRNRVWRNVSDNMYAGQRQAKPGINFVAKATFGVDCRPKKSRGSSLASQDATNQQDDGPGWGHSSADPLNYWEADDHYCVEFSTVDEETEKIEKLVADVRKKNLGYGGKNQNDFKEDLPHPGGFPFTCMMVTRLQKNEVAALRGSLKVLKTCDFITFTGAHDRAKSITEFMESKGLLAQGVKEEILEGGKRGKKSDSQNKSDLNGIEGRPSSSSDKIGSTSESSTASERNKFHLAHLHMDFHSEGHTLSLIRGRLFEWVKARGISLPVQHRPDKLWGPVTHR
jgi:hypothetical protein